jgi:hypothetical protein
LPGAIHLMTVAMTRYRDNLAVMSLLSYTINITHLPPHLKMGPHPKMGIGPLSKRRSDSVGVSTRQYPPYVEANIFPERAD